MPTWRAPFPPRTTTSIVQTCELNRGRTEARCLIAFDTTASTVNFPSAEQGARSTRCIDSPRKSAKKIETEYLITSLSARQLGAEQMLATDRGCWGIEAGLHSRLDVTAGEDRSRVRKRPAALNLAVMRRAVISVAIHWMQRCRKKRQATLSGFHDWMSARNHKRAFALVTRSHPSWLPKS